MATKPAYGTALATGHSLYTGLVARYLMNDNSGTTPDDSGAGAYHLTASAGPTWATGSDGGPSVSFPSGRNRNLTVPTGVRAQLGGDATLLIRLSATAITGGGSNILFDNRNGGNINLLLELQTTAVLKFSTGNGGGISNTPLTGGSLSVATPYTIICVREGLVNTIYVNGSSVASQTGTTLGGVASSGPWIGGDAAATAGFGFYGLLDTVGLWSRALTSGEIAALSSDPYEGYLTAVPTISGISPTSGAFGEVVTVTGTHLNTLTGLTLNGVAVLYRVDSSTQITVVVDDGATTGVFEATNPLGSATSGTFTVTGGGGGGLVRPAVGWQWPLDV